VSCLSAEHRRYKAYAALMVLVYPIGVPALLFLALSANRDRINPPGLEPEEAMSRRSKDGSILSFGFLWISYEPRCW
jgi:hypothetical protein